MRQPIDNDSASGSKSSSLAKASSQHLSASLRRTEDLRKRTGSHLSIPDGKRLKHHYDPPRHSVQPRRPGRMTNKNSKFDFDMCSLAPKQDDRVTGGTSLMELSDSNEFPEPVELVRASIRSAGKPNGSLASCASDYSDADMDDLIRDAVLGGITSTGIDSTKTQDSSVPKSIQQKRKEEGRAVTLTKRTRTPTGTFSPQVRMLRIQKILL